MTTPYPSDLLEALAQYGVRVYLKEGRLIMRHPWPGWENVPSGVIPLLRELKRQRQAVRAYLQRHDAAATGYETRLWIPGREIEWLWDNTRPMERKLTPIQRYIRGRIEGTIPPPEHPPKEPYRDTLPDGIPVPMDFRWDSERQEWVLEPGWWRELPGKGVH